MGTWIYYQTEDNVIVEHSRDMHMQEKRQFKHVCHTVMSSILLVFPYLRWRYGGIERK